MRYYLLCLLLSFLYCGSCFAQDKIRFSLDSVTTPLKFKVKAQQDEGQKKKKTRLPFTITITKDSINFKGGHYLTASQKPTVYYYITEKLDRKGVWKDVFQKDPSAYGYQGYYHDRFGTFKFYIFFSPKKNKYELLFTHTVLNSIFYMERQE